MDRSVGQLAGKIVVVTGAARGQGAAEVEALARAGATVVGTDVLDDEGAALAARLAGDGLDVGYVHLDVRDQTGWDALAERLRVGPGRVDALVNNAGVAARERLPHVSPEGWRLAFDVNVTGPLLGIQALVPLMRPGASIVNICSVAAVAGHAAAAYTASKWALRGLTRTASLELGIRGIRVNAVLPGTGRHPADGGRVARVHRGGARRDPAGPGRGARGHRADDRLPRLRRLRVLQRRRDRHRRRPQRARLAQADRGRQTRPRLEPA